MYGKKIKVFLFSFLEIFVLNDEISTCCASID